MGLVKTLCGMWDTFKVDRARETLAHRLKDTFDKHNIRFI